MTQLVIRGNVRQFFTHFAAYGLAAILEAATRQTVTVRTLSPQELEVDVAADVSPTDLAEKVREHADAHLDSWVSATFGHFDRTTGVLSPRMKAPETAEHWRALQQARHGELDRAISSTGAFSIDLAFMQALGEPAYWFLNNSGKPEPDRGASSWEMKTRNRGEEFVQQRLLPLAEAVARRTTAEVLSGLTGETLVDEAGKDSLDSRTPTGLMLPAQTDNALAWCALWGISLFPVVQSAASPGRFKRSGQRAITPGILRNLPRLHPSARAAAYLPLFSKPMRLSRLRSVLVSGPLARVSARMVLERTQLAQSRNNHTTLGGKVRQPVDAEWLKRKGVEAVLLSYIHASDNPNAPELHVPAGSVISLEELRS